MRELSSDEFNRSLDAAVQTLRKTEFCRKRSLGPVVLRALASYITNYVAERMEKTAKDAAAMPEQEFITAAQPLIEFLDARWF